MGKRVTKFESKKIIRSVYKEMINALDKGWRFSCEDTSEDTGDGEKILLFSVTLSKKVDNG